MRRLAALVVSGSILVGVGGTVIALRSRGSEDVFRIEQSRSLTIAPATALSAARVEAVVAKAPEPVRPARRTRPAQVRCSPGTGGTLRNPWSCKIRYRSGMRAHYRVVVEPDGYYRGAGTGIIEGCCVKVPTLD
jgi:hypothetical protein